MTDMQKESEVIWKFHAIEKSGWNLKRHQNRWIISPSIKIREKFKLSDAAHFVVENIGEASAVVDAIETIFVLSNISGKR